MHANSGVRYIGQDCITFGKTSLEIVGMLHTFRIERDSIDSLFREIKVTRLMLYT